MSMPSAATGTLPGGRTLFPYVAHGLTGGALEVALRLARAEQGTLVPVLLLQVPLQLPLDAPLPRSAGMAVALQETIEERAAGFKVPVESRIERGRTLSQALELMLAHEQCDRVVLAAASGEEPGFAPADVAWLLAHATAEIIVLRPARRG
jgi:nucleotide-binding universal stress UspA family protein